MEGTRPLRGQPYPVFKCGQDVKVNVNFLISALAKVKFNAVLMLTLILKY